MQIKLARVGACVVVAAFIAVSQAPAQSHDGSTSPADGIVTTNETIYPSGGNDDAFNGVRVFLSSPRHSSSGSRGECTSPGRQENVNGRYWNMFASDGNWVYGTFNPASRTRNFHARGFGVRVGKNKKDDDYADNVAASIYFGANLHVVTHTNAAGSCGNGADYFLTMWEHYGDQLHCNAYMDQVNPDVPGPGNQWQEAGLLELERNASNGDCYVELQFHTNPARQAWMYSESIHNSFTYGRAIDTGMGYP